jgi:hypothetical protein
MRSTTAAAARTTAHFVILPVRVFSEAVPGSLPVAMALCAVEFAQHSRAATVFLEQALFCSHGAVRRGIRPAQPCYYSFLEQALFL